MKLVIVALAFLLTSAPAFGDAKEAMEKHVDAFIDCGMREMLKAGALLKSDYPPEDVADL